MAGPPMGASVLTRHASPRFRPDVVGRPAYQERQDRLLPRLIR
ncbi:hypothetical protein HMPREF9056_00250 [Actinomyces sp. oral taxon 170 str. F0386]|nr:hypothetical protein HMPREF9056_00250 [Actinomyces sp. oral taxon 170 str. F0386]